MAKNTTQSIPADTWAEITAAAVSSIAVQNRGGYCVWLRCSATTPVSGDLSGAIVLPPRAMITADIPLSAIWPGLTGTQRVWAWCDANTDLMVSHA